MECTVLSQISVLGLYSFVLEDSLTITPRCRNL